MNKCRIKFLSWILMIAFLIGGCGSLEVDKEAQNKGQQNKEDISSEQTITLADCIPLENILVLCHRDGGGDYRYMDPIPAEYWNIKYDSTGTKGIAVQYDGKMFKLYADGTVIDEAGNIKKKAPKDPNDEVDIFTAWILTLRGDDMLGHDAIYNNMSYDVEKVLTVDELRNLIHVVQITAENFDEYFTFIDVEQEKEITGSNFEENHIYKPYKTLRAAYKGPGYLMNSPSFEWRVNIDLSYTERSSGESYDGQGNIQDSSEDGPEDKRHEMAIVDYEFVYQEEGEYRDICYENAHPAFEPLLQYYINSDSTMSKRQYFYENIIIHKANGYFIYCDDIPDDRWNVTEKGNRYVCVQREDKSAWRFCEYGRIGANEKDVDGFLETDITATIDGEPKKLRGDILSLNGNDLNNFIGIKLESLLGAE